MAVNFVNLLRQFPCVHVDNRQVGVLYFNPFLFGLIHLLMVFVGNIAPLVLYHVADIDLIAEQLAYCYIVPHFILAVGIGLAECLIVVFPRRENPRFVEGLGNLAKAQTLAAKRENLPHNSGGGFVNDETVGVLRVFEVAVRGVAADIFPRLAGGLPDGFYLAAGVTGVKIVHYIFENHNHLIVLVNGVHTIIQGNEAAPQRGENDINVFARFNVITPEAA